MTSHEESFIKPSLTPSVHFYFLPLSRTYTLDMSLVYLLQGMKILTVAVILASLWLLFLLQSLLSSFLGTTSSLLMRTNEVPITTVKGPALKIITKAEEGITPGNCLLKWCQFCGFTGQIYPGFKPGVAKSNSSSLQPFILITSISNYAAIVYTGHDRYHLIFSW